MRLVKVVGGWPGATLVPPVSLKLDLEAARPPPARRHRARGPRRQEGRRDHHRPGRRRAPAAGGPARATTGEVRPGFSKEEILRKPESDPRAEGGMFPLVGLLQALGGEASPFRRSDVKLRY